MLVRLLLAMVMGRDLNSGGERSRSLVVRVALLGIDVLKVLLGVGRLLRLMLVRILCVVCRLGCRGCGLLRVRLGLVLLLLL